MNMDSMFVQGHVQIWNGKTGMSQSKVAFIETVVGKTAVKLVLHYSTGKIKNLQLYNNIKTVVLRTYEEDQNYLHLTFQNNNFLFVEKLSTPDAKFLKVFLDRVRLNKIQPSARGKMPLFQPKSLLLTSKGLNKKRLKKRKRTPSCISEKNDKKVLEENNSSEKENLEANSLMCVNDEVRQQLELRPLEDSKSALACSSATNIARDPSCNEAGPQTLITRKFLPLISEPDSVTSGIKWNEYQKSLLLCPQKAWQGLPNVGNTCYINAVLQSLCSIPLFVNDLFNQGFPWVKLPSDAFNMYLMQLLVLKDVFNLKTRQQFLINIKNALPSFGDIFTADMQNDAHEFLSLCLVQLKEAIQNVNKAWDISNEFGEKYSFQQIYIDSAATEMLACPVTSNFEFELLSSIVCKACDTIVLRREPSSYLSINLPQGMKAETLSIQSSLDLFFRAEELERTCEKCSHNRSIVLQKFSKLPRILIIHLKRYSFTESRVMKKDEQRVIISKYLNLSCHCNSNTKPPHPLSKNAHIKDTDLLKSLHEMRSEIISLKFPSLTVTSESEDAPGACIGLNNESRPQTFQRFLKGSSTQQQEDPGKHSSPSDTKLDSTDEEDGIFEKLKKCEETNAFGMSELGAIIETTKYEMSQIHGIGQQYNENKIPKESPEQIPLQSLPMPSVPRQVENSQNVKLNPPCSLQSSKTPENKCVLDLKTQSEANTPERSALNEDINPVYRLVDVISHLGNSLHSGHYITDAYDFKKKLWFTFSDLQVSSINEDQMLKARTSTGYVFFYMYNQFFEELSARENNSQSSGTSQD